MLRLTSNGLSFQFLTLNAVSFTYSHRQSTIVMFRDQDAQGSQSPLLISHPGNNLPKCLNFTCYHKVKTIQQPLNVTEPHFLHTEFI
jgi:hypothetical protein